DGPLTLVGLVDRPSGPVHSHPPQRGPVLVIVIHEQGYRAVGPDVLQSAEIKRGLGLGVDRRVDGADVEYETARDQMGPVRCRHRGQMPHSGRGESSSGRAGIHVSTVSTYPSRRS